MSALDLSILGFALLVACAANATRRDALLRVASLALALLLVAQLWEEGFYWQFVPAYALLAIGWGSLISTAERTRAARLALLAATALVTLLLAVCWIIPPVPQIPAPSGPHRVGTMIARWELPARDEPATDSPTDRRNVVVQAWYPADASSEAGPAPYMDGLAQLPERVAGLPRALLRRFDRIDTHAVLSAPVATSQARWPVVIFSPGYSAARAFYTTLLSDLASRGFIVLAMDHPYESAITQLADGRIVTQVERLLPDEPTRIPYMIRQAAIRVADIRAVMEAIHYGRAGGPLGALTDRMDRDRIAAIGHSFGGAASVSAAGEDSRIRWAVNIDGTLYGSLPVLAGEQRFLLIESDRAETKHGAPFLEGNARLLASLRGAGQRCQITRANHYSFTDAPLLLSRPARWVASLLLGGSRGTEETVRVTNETLVAFLSDSARLPCALAGRPVKSRSNREGTV
jgi:predicted dienelactone hydrolase